MISDITIGQYYSGTSVIHRMDARMKFVLTMALIVILFVCRNFYSLALGLVFVNDIKISKPDAPVKDGDKVVLRGMGKAKIISSDGVSKKGRTVIIFDRYR